jgi:SAM-dependent methyltransferase
MLEKIFRFNEFNRDRFVERWANTISPGARVLDVGAGPCRYRSTFSHCNYQTQDFGNYGGSGTGAHREDWQYGKIDYTCDATSIPVEAGTFDAILSTEVLEHVPDPGAVVREIARLLKPGGKLLLTAPLGSGLHQEPYHFYGGFTPHWYRKFLGEAGFESVEVRENGGFFKLYAQESQRFSFLIGPKGGKGWTRIALFPVWLMTLPYFRFFLPVACHFLDRTDGLRSFTVGYNVTAIRASVRPT